MTKTDFDTIVVGGGMAGSAAAIRLAQKGVDVLLVERADEGGAKNLSGGVLWGDDLAAILPDWKEQMPVERPISNKKVGFLGDGNAFVIDYHDESLKTDTIGHSVLRAKTDAWLLKQAEEAGATVVTGVNVEGLHKVNGKVAGVEQGGEITTGRVTIIADGANSRLTLEGDLRHGQQKLDAHHYALGVKEILKLPKDVMEDRFLTGDDGGMAGEFVLGRKDGIMAGGFLYTNQDSLSLGVVVNLPSLANNKAVTTHDLVEHFRLHPYIAKLTKDAELEEYGAHLVPEGGYQAFSELSADGALVVGDAAGFCFSNGIVIQGMNYGVKSGIAAADAAAHAVEKRDATRVTLRRYEKLLEKEHVIGDFKRFQNVNKFLWNPRLFNQYPEFLANTMRGMLTVDGPKQKMKNHVFNAMNAAGVRKKDLMADALSGGMNL
ncbi:MAG: FAD-dependent oxidoreductase [Thermoplasmatota archaeon]